MALDGKMLYANYAKMSQIDPIEDNDIVHRENIANRYIDHDRCYTTMCYNTHIRYLKPVLMDCKIWGWRCNVI